MLGSHSQEELHQAPADARLDDLLDLVVGAVRQVRQRPARVCQDLLVIGVDQPRQRGQRQLRLQRGQLASAWLEGKHDYHRLAHMYQ